jgi:nitroreductase
MNPVLEPIRQRRSVRSYKADSVPKDTVQQIIAAGNWAPTGHNMQLWRFVVVEDRQLRQKLVETTRPTWRRAFGGWADSTDAQFRDTLTAMTPRCLGWPPQSYEDTIARLVELEDGMYWEAPVVIFVIGSRPSECWMVCQNMVLAAHSLGLGSCIVGFGAGVTSDTEIVEALELHENEKIFGPVVVGYAQIYPEPPEKKPPVVKWV